MLKSYLTVIWRNIYRQPAYTILNLTCLTIGIAATLIILLYIDFELNFDRFHAKADRTHRVITTKVKTHDKVLDNRWQNTPANLAPYIIQDYPEFEQFARFFYFWDETQLKLKYKNTVIEEEEIIAVDSSVFNIFSIDLINGSPKQALKGPNKIVLSENLARRIFGNENPVGKLLETNMLHSTTGIDSTYSLIVSGIYKDMPNNTSLFAHAMISAETDPELDAYYFGRFNVTTYVLLKEGVDKGPLAGKLTKIYDNYLDSNRDPTLVNASHELVPLTDIHMETTGGYTYIYIFVAIGLLLLLISIISYVNLVTAQASRRALEIGIRKVMGSDRKQLIFQFLAESVVFTMLSLFLAICIVVMAVTPLNSVFDLKLQAQQLWQPQLILGIITIIFTLGILGGSYPAFFLSAFKPISVMKNKSMKAAPLRRVLVAVQFIVVIFVLSCTGMIYDQLQYLQGKNLGFDKEQVVQMTISGKENVRKAPVFKETLRKNSNIISAATCSFTPGIGGMTKRPVSAEGKGGPLQEFVRSGQIDYDYLEAMGIKLVAGRNFSLDHPSDYDKSVIINKAFARTFDLEEPALNSKVRLGSIENPNFFSVIGVVEDFHQSSLHTDIEPQFFWLEPASHRVTIKVGKDLKAGLAHIEKTWAEVYPNDDFEFRFLDDIIQESYEDDLRRGKIFLAFSFLTILISFLGLFGLASYLARQRVKEVGIRKVLGASAWDTVMLMTKNFMLLVVFAAIPAFIGAWYIISKWLENFAFQTQMNYILFGLALFLTLVLTFLTTGLHALKASQVNPAETLKYE